LSGVSCLGQVSKNNGIADMALDRTKDSHYEGLNASIAFATAFFEQTGLRELIDSKFTVAEAMARIDNSRLVPIHI